MSIVPDRIENEIPTRRDLTLLINGGWHMLLCPLHLACYDSLPEDGSDVDATRTAPAIGHCAACLFVARSVPR